MANTDEVKRGINENIDNALETAARHAREAEERLRQRPIDSRGIIAEAQVVHHLVEDLDVLAQEAAFAAESENL